MKKSIKFLAFAASCVVMVTACGNDNNDENSGNESSSSSVDSSEPSSSSVGSGEPSSSSVDETLPPSSSSVGGGVDANGACHFNIDMGIMSMQMCLTPLTKDECDLASQELNEDDPDAVYQAEYFRSCPPDASLECQLDEGTVYYYSALITALGLTCEDLLSDDE